MTKEYIVPCLITISAESYADAVVRAEKFVSKIKQQFICEMDIVHDFEYDNEGQRVIYLPSVEE